MLYIILGLLFIVIIALLYIFFLQKKHFEELKDKLTTILVDAAKENQKQIEKNNEMSSSLLKSASELNDTLKNELYERFKDINSRFEEMSSKLNESLSLQTEKNQKDLDRFMHLVEDKLFQISNRVDERLKEGFENVDKTFKDIIEGIAKISEAQRKIEELSSEVVSLQRILDDKKKRGNFGEARLETILESVFGPKKELYDIQFKLNNQGMNVIADAIIKAPQIGIIAIDSKFPLENYLKMIDAEEKDKMIFKKAFENDLKKHIDDIANKYIIKGVTADMAIMFLPAESIFAEINAYHENVVAYSYSKRVWIASPTTLMALLTTISAAVRDMKIHQQAKRIQEELIKLSKEFERYRLRWEKLMKDMNRLHKDAEDMDTTTQKIAKAFERIENVEFEDIGKITNEKN